MSEKQRVEPQSIVDAHSAELNRLNELVSAGLLEILHAGNGDMFYTRMPGGDFPVAIALKDQEIVVRSGDVVAFERDGKSEKYRVGEFRLDDSNNEITSGIPVPATSAESSQFRIQDISANISAISRRPMITK